MRSPGDADDQAELMLTVVMTIEELQWLGCVPDDSLDVIFYGDSNSFDAYAYCRIGERSSHTWFVLKELLGYTHPQLRRELDSVTEYGSVTDVPIENPYATPPSHRS